VRFASGWIVVLLLTSRAHAEHHTHEQAKPDARAALADQLTQELATLAKTIDTVRGKLADADALRLRRVRAAYRILHAPVPSDATSDNRMASARRRAAAKLLLERDHAERELLANETHELEAAEVTMRAADAKLPDVVLPEHVLRPVKGTIARHFGVYIHDASKATLSRHGLDFECESGAAVSAPADGVVRYAGAIRGLDHGVILDHGDYMTVVAKLDTVVLPVGVKVLRGDRLGHAARRRVYLEVRAKVGPGGLPIDPEPLLQTQ
jgi:murein DD-endopeptidase MepM/ murein hydrolase activator NlpD